MISRPWSKMGGYRLPVQGTQLRVGSFRSLEAMRLGPMRPVTAILLALALAAPSICACACESDGHLDAPIPVSHRSETHASGMEHSHSPSAAPSHSHNESGHDGCGDHGSCGCSCLSTGDERTLPAAQAVIASPELPVVLFFQPEPELQLGTLHVEEPGFFGYDSGPPSRQPRLPVQDRSPPAICA